MNRLIILFALLMISYSLQAQPVFSEPLDIPQSGWNKILQLKNGNTALLHLELRRPITMYIFDRTGKQIAKRFELSAFIDINELDKTSLKGFYEIGSGPVLFLVQFVNGKNTLVRICFDSLSGKIIKENIVVQSESRIKDVGTIQANMIDQSESKTKDLTFFLAKSPVTDEYAVMHVQNITQQKDVYIKLSLWNGIHEKTKEVIFQFDKTDLVGDNKIYFMGMDMDSHGNVYVSLSLTKSDIEHFAVVGSLPKDSSNFIYRTIDLGNKYVPFLVNFVESAEGMKALMLTNTLVETESKRYFGLPMSFIINIDNSDFSLKAIKKFAHSYCGLAKPLMFEKVDSFGAYLGIPLDLAKNNVGTAVISEYAWKSVEKLGKYERVTQLHDICITSLDANNSELSGTIIPYMQYAKNFIGIAELARRKTSKYLFRDNAEQSYQNQFISYDYRTTSKDICVILNDEFAMGKNENVKAIFDCHYAEAICYHVSKDGKLEKSFLFGEPDAKKYRAAFLESAAYDAEKDSYATLVSESEDKKTIIRLAWLHLN